MSAHQFSPRPDYADVRAYRPDRPVVEIDLSDSTNQWSVAPSALAALKEWTPRDISEYPAVDPLRLRAAYASYAGVDANSVITGCGSDDLLDSAIRALASPGESMAHPAPTFGNVPVRARASGVHPVAVPVLENGDADAEGLLATGARIIYLCTPNNPTGVPHSRGTVERVIRDAPGVVILDEAYAEFADEVHTPWASKQPHVFVTRTLSKSFGLAGLRIGFGVGTPAVLAEVEKARGPYRVTSLSDRAATAALEHDRAWMVTLAAEVRVVREQFRDSLRGIGLAPLPSQGNFVCVPVPDAVATVKRLYAHGIAVRGFPGLPRIGDALRIGLAPWPVLVRVRDALKSVLA